MNSFEEFMDVAKKESGKGLASSETTLAEVQTAIAARVEGILAAPSVASSSITNDEQKKFLDQVSGLVQDKSFISDF
ncbi:MAG: hypothetical protein WBA99_00360, partial [Nodosilinea sp.]